MRKYLFLVGVLLSTGNTLLAQGWKPQEQLTGSEILHQMQKLNVVGSVLYIAAHPDDENTRLLAWLANEKKVSTGYLSLTSPGAMAARTSLAPSKAKPWALSVPRNF
jgi:hypothetical protein